MSMSPLKQPFYIFRKDALHLWPETLISIVLLIAYASVEVQTWAPVNTESMTLTVVAIKLASVGLAFLLPISWLVLTSRLVHDEELVGDRQFWITRPYTWYSLLASKVLYLVVFVGIPFLVMQAWLLHHAGLYPTQVVPALLKNLLLIAAVFLLPLFAIAAVTATFPRYISSVLGGFIYFWVVVFVAGYAWTESFMAPYFLYAMGGTVLALIVAAIILQYARRKTLIARLLLAAVPVVIVLFAALTPVNLLSNHRYPANSAGTVAFDTDPMRKQPAGRLFNFRGKVVLELPVQVKLSGMDDKSIVAVQSIRLLIDDPNGYHYTSDWSSDQAEFSPEQSGYVLMVRLPETVYNRIHNQPVAVHLQLGTQIIHAGTEYSVPATETAFPAPSHAACTVSAENGQLECRYPFANPTFTQVSAVVHNGNCLAPGPLSAPAYGALTPTAVSFGFSPVEIARTALKIRTTAVPLCPGTRTTFTPTVAGAYGRMTADIPAITLDPYARRIPVKPEGELTPGPTPQP
jgi:hypothetical protein